MNPPAIFPQPVWVPTHEIDRTERTYALTPSSLPPPFLVDSIRRCHGLTSPICVQQWEDGYRIVCGFRRCEAAVQVGLDRLPVFVLTGRPVELLQRSLLDNSGHRPFSESEKAGAVVKLRRGFEVPEQEVFDAWFPILGIRPNRKMMRRYLRLGQLRDALRRALDLVPPATVLALARWEEPEQDSFLRLIEEFRLSGSRQKLAFRLLDELRALPGSKGVERILTEAAEELGPVRENPKQELGRLLGWLKQRRYPNLVAMENRAHQLTASLRLPPAVRLHLPEFFEGDRVRIELEARDSSEFRELVDQLARVSSRAELEELFELL